MQEDGGSSSLSVIHAPDKEIDPKPYADAFFSRFDARQTRQRDDPRGLQHHHSCRVDDGCPDHQPGFTGQETAAIRLRCQRLGHEKGLFAAR